jgi:hypothetical protein
MLMRRNDVEKLSNLISRRFVDVTLWKTYRRVIDAHAWKRYQKIIDPNQSTFRRCHSVENLSTNHR